MKKTGKLKLTRLSLGRVETRQLVDVRGGIIYLDGGGGSGSGGGGGGGVSQDCPVSGSGPLCQTYTCIQPG